MRYTARNRHGALWGPASENSTHTSSVPVFTSPLNGLEARLNNPTGWSLMLVSCPYCQKEISNNVPACSHCGCPLHATMVEQAGKMCPTCGSINLKQKKKISGMGWKLFFGGLFLFVINILIIVPNLILSVGFIGLIVGSFCFAFSLACCIYAIFQYEIVAICKDCGEIEESKRG